jgi:hypothetical protein
MQFMRFNDHRAVWFWTLDEDCCYSGVESIVSSQYENDIEHNLREEAFIDDDDASEDMLNILELFTILMATCQFEWV